MQMIAHAANIYDASKPNPMIPNSAVSNQILLINKTLWMTVPSSS